MSRPIKFRVWDGARMLHFSLASLMDNYGDDCPLTPEGEDTPPHSGERMNNQPAGGE